MSLQLGIARLGPYIGMRFPLLNGTKSAVSMSGSLGSEDPIGIIDVEITLIGSRFRKRSVREVCFSLVMTSACIHSSMTNSLSYRNSNASIFSFLSECSIDVYRRVHLMYEPESKSNENYFQHGQRHRQPFSS